MKTAQVIVIGGGLSGLTAARELAQLGLEVVLFEKQELPHHKVCGEYLSKEVVPYLKASGIPLEDTPDIRRLILRSSGGYSLSCELPLGGIGISRYALDYRLFQAAEKAGVHFEWETVEKVHFEDPDFRVTTRNGQWQAEHVLGHWGKRSVLDRIQNRSFFNQSSPWMGIKMHYRATYPADQVGLYGFQGGYGGLSVTETGAVNFCYLIHRERFKEAPNLEGCTQRLLEEHPALHDVLDTAEPLFDRPLGISNIYFGSREIHQQHVLMSGDAARLIHPLCGNGMAMAIQAGRLQAEVLQAFVEGEITKREHLESQYQKAWNKEFRTRLWVGAQLQRILVSPNGLNLGIQLGTRVPGLVRAIIRKTHGTA